MSQAIETLMNEHRVIERVLSAIETASRETRDGAPLERARVAEFADFFKNFADTCHHGKEEDLLFRKMLDAGFPRDEGPIAVMLADHAVGREHVAALGEVGAAAGPLTPPERASFVELADAYVAMLRQHILKEDRILYPMATRAIPPADMTRMAADFDEFERNVMGAGVHEGFHRLAESLSAAYGVTPGTHAGCGCHGHA